MLDEHLPRWMRGDRFAVALLQDLGFITQVWDDCVDGDTVLTRDAVEEAMVDYMERAHAEDGVGWYSVASHMLGLRNGLKGARRWRQVWSDHHLKPESPRVVSQRANIRPDHEAAPR